MVIDEKNHESIRSKTVLQHTNHPVPASEATINLNWESDQELRGPNYSQLLTAWCDNKCKPGAPLQNNNKKLA